uniref:helix-turn-helix domain-containing protein n=1 Tax=Paractinoplanes polyasparticus TaxID=2856853 RepID=UPI001C85640C|nr:helix-turn-helix transcriptional regulator [Actinoplanes polyasparticus]
MRGGPQIGQRPLSPRQRELLGLVAEGLTGPEIAARMGTTVGTVRTRIRDLLWRYSASSQREMVGLARKAGDLEC